jgi:hypothetical protein
VVGRGEGRLGRDLQLDRLRDLRRGAAEAGVFEAVDEKACDRRRDPESDDARAPRR